MRIRMLALVAGTALLAACSGSKGSTSGGSTGTTGACDPSKDTCPCTDDSQCPADQGYSCDKDQTKTCIWQCTDSSSCTADTAPQDVRTACQSASLGCTCDFDPASNLSACTSKGCGTDSDCGPGQVCQDAQCVAPSVASVDRCAVFPEYQVLNAGQSFTFHVQAYAGNKPVRVPDSAVTWSAGSALTGTGPTFTANAGGSNTDSTGPTATINGQSCSSKVRVYAAASGVRVVVVDALSGEAIPNAPVQVDDVAVVNTDANGVASGFSGLSGSVHTISVFADEFDYVTLYKTGATDVLIPVTRNAKTLQGGVTGTVNNLFQANSKIHLGFIGTSLAGSITDLSTTLLLGRTEPLSGTVGNQSFNVSVPGGVLLGLNDQNFKDHFSALGAAGYCAGQTAGTCGVRSVWGLAGDMDLDKVSPIIDQVQGGSLSTINIGSVLNSLLPVFRDFNSLVKRDQTLALGPQVNGEVDPAKLAAITLDNKRVSEGGTDAVRMGLKITVKVPDLPKLAGKFVDGAIVLSAVDVPGRGLVPLGLSAGIDNTGTSTSPVTDGKVSDEKGVTGQVILNTAPAHGGAEGGDYRLAILASSFSNISNGLVGSGIVVNPAGCQGGTGGVCYGSTINSNQTFLGFPEGASYDYGSRSLTLGSSVVSGTKLERLDFNATDRRWFIYFDPNVAGGLVSLPNLPTGVQDRTLDNGGRSSFLLVAFDLNNSAGLDDVATFGGSKASLQKLDRYINRFTIKDYPAASIQITSPTANATVHGGDTVKVTISGDEQYGSNWYLCVSGSSAKITSLGANCAAGIAPSGSTPGTATVPSGITSGTQFLHAVLVDNTPAPLSPPAEDVIQVTVP